MNQRSWIELGVDGVSLAFVARACTVDERVGAPFVARIHCEISERGEAVSAVGLDILGERAWLVLGVGEHARRFEGIVDRVEDHEGHSVIVLVHRVAEAEGGRGYWGAPGFTSAVEVARSFFERHGFRFENRARRTPPTRAHRLQSFESDLSFVTRVLAEEGLSWYPCTGERDAVRIADEPGTFDDDGLVLRHREDAGLEGGPSLRAARLVRRAASDVAHVRGYDYERPELDIAGESGEGSLEWYELSRDARSPAEASELAAIRLGERRREATVLEGEATTPLVAAGSIVTVEESPVAAQNGRFLVLSVIHEASLNPEGDGLVHHAVFRAVPASSTYRPARTRTPPRGGVSTARVRGPSGEEIAVDAHGRTSLVLRWDAFAGPARVVEPALAGSAFHPRVGWEQVVAFADDACEVPLVLGRLYNGADPPPLVLPAQKVETHLGTKTTPAGERGHFLRISDAAGTEQLSIQSSGDYQELSENDKVSVVQGDLGRVVGGSRELFVKENLNTAVDGAHSLSVGAERAVTTDADHAVWASAESISVGGARFFSIGGDSVTKAPRLVRIVGGAKTEAPLEHQSVHTEGAGTLIVGGSMNTTAGISEVIAVGGAAVVKVSGPMTVTANGYGLDVLGVYAESHASRNVKAGGNVAESFGTLSHAVKGNATIAGAEVAIEAKARLVVKAGGMTIQMTPGTIEIQGDFQGSVASVEGGVSRYG
ncbi:type VI secretion system Vgr family protein [Polyangium jinanense]|uniref:Type VI secretion system tip protein VgrG n=1 Tax=Polyangium jinanense TaxID=2829994 RepID=A0A9X3XGN9_9BACT|nr:type VI secretion system tip protein TssI/VgrG [Polyangium jinanense]MDC3961367.1 type VI secretion system tip protein VgrG [Polyangium jinanense]MDC3987746.1 type VI secretion system tip protein VgrG [Polyangium jinanense]